MVFIEAKKRKIITRLKMSKQKGRVKLAGVCGGPCNPSYWEAGVWDA